MIIAKWEKKIVFTELGKTIENEEKRISQIRNNNESEIRYYQNKERTYDISKILFLTVGGLASFIGGVGLAFLSIEKGFKKRLDLNNYYL